MFTLIKNLYNSFRNKNPYTLILNYILQNKDIYSLISDNYPSNLDNLDQMDYEFPPYISKDVWEKEGTYVSKKEKMRENVERRQYFTLRLDIKNMSKIKKIVFEEKWSTDFARIMQQIALRLAVDFNAKLAYTQSDEITLLFCPGENENFEYMFGGRHDKLVSLTASTASSIFNLEVRNLVEKGLKIYQDWDQFNLIINFMPLVIFDCRMAVFDSFKDAFRLILWRSYDCGINGISDAVHNMDETVGLLGKKKRSALNTKEKLSLLKEYNLLPLPSHQAYGSLFMRKKVIKKGWNPKEKKFVESLRSVVEKVESTNVINMIKDGSVRLDEC